MSAVFGVPIIRSSIFGSIVGSPYLGKLPSQGRPACPLHTLKRQPSKEATKKNPSSTLPKHSITKHRILVTIIAVIAILEGVPNLKQGSGPCSKEPA